MNVKETNKVWLIERSILGKQYFLKTFKTVVINEEKGPH